MDTPQPRRPSRREGRSRTLALAALTAALAVAGAAALAQLPPPPAPPENPLTVAKANLGKILFWDEQLSSSRTVACGTCHIPAVGGEDPRSGVNPLAVNPGPDGNFGGADDVFGSLGLPESHADGLYDWNAHFGLTEQVTPRRTVPSINAGYSAELFWDGRAASEFRDPVTDQVVIASGGALESQAVVPPLGDVEMAHVGRVWADVVARISAVKPLALSPQVPSSLLIWIDGRTYPQLFQAAFGTTDVTAARVGMAIASHERTLFTNQSPFDQFLATGQGLTAQELAGNSVFNGAAHCVTCHQLAIMSDHQFHYTGVRPTTDDAGRFVVTNDEADRGKMRTPSLRNIELRAPYMHNGRLATLEDVVEFYDDGGHFSVGTPPNELQILNLTATQKTNLLAFLKRPLTDPRLVAGLPPFDRPKLYTESPRVPTVMGTGTAGTAGKVPAMVALEPPLIGNPNFTVGVWNALAGANALLVIDDVDPGPTPPGSGDLAFVNVTLGDAGIGAGSGFGSAAIAIPNDPAIDGKEWFGRWYVTDAGAAGGFAVSRLLHFRTFRSTAIFATGFESGNTSAWSATVP